MNDDHPLLQPEPDPFKWVFIILAIFLFAAAIKH